MCHIDVGAVLNSRAAGKLTMIAMLHILICCCRPSNTSNNSAISRSSSVELIRTQNQPSSLPIHSVTRLPQYMENRNLRSPRTQNLTGDIPLINSIGSIEPQLPGNDNLIIRRTSTTSSLPPAYDNETRQSSVTITVGEQCLLPPTYDDFMRRNNERIATEL